jgi:cytochrome P450
VPVNSLAADTGLRGPGSPASVQAFRFHRHPARYVAENQQRYGRIFALEFPFSGPAAVVTDRAEVEFVLGSDYEHAHGGEARRGILGMVSPRAILGSDGEQHRTGRERISPSFGSGFLEDRRPLMREIAARHVREWPRNRPFRLLPKMRAIVDEVFVHAVIGVEDDERAEAMSRGIRQLIWTPGNPPTFVPAPDDGILGRMTDLEFTRRADRMTALFGDEIDARRAAGDPGAGILGDYLAAAPDAETGRIADELLPVCMAGQEPIAAALAWLAESVWRRGAEGGARRWVDGDPLEAPFVKETFRLRPPVHSVGRKLIRDKTVSGVDLPAGTVVLMPILALHRDQSYGDPAAFRPERFEDEDAWDLPYFPFGGGARRCLGENLARLEIAAVIEAILENRRLEFLSPRPERAVVRGTILVPRLSSPVIVR